MAKQEKKTPVVYHKDHLTDEIRNGKEPYTYTENWKNVTDPKHLEIRKKQLKDAEKNQTVDDAPPAANS